LGREWYAQASSDEDESLLEAFHSLRIRASTEQAESRNREADENAPRRAAPPRRFHARRPAPRLIDISLQKIRQRIVDTLLNEYE